MNKKGDLTSTQIITLVIAIIGFGIVLIALFLVNLGDYTAEETCHLSVLTRATAPSALQGAVPLKCVAKKICLGNSASSGCEAQFAGEQNVEYVKLKGTKDEMRRQIEEVSANAMYDCWKMMGEGKLDIFGSYAKEAGITAIGTTCVICSRVAVDNGVNKTILTEFERDSNGSIVNDSNGNPKTIGGVDINNYMATHQVPGSSLTYLQTFTDRGVSSYASVSGGFNAEDYNKKIEQGVADSGSWVTDILTKVKVLSNPMADDSARVDDLQEKGALSGNSNNQMAFVFMQIKSETIGDVLANQVVYGSTAAAGVSMTPAGKVFGVGKAIIGYLPYGKAIMTIGAGGAAVTAIGYGAYNAYQGQLTAARHCGELETNDAAATKGCSMVQGLNYTFRDINALCASIQGEL